MSVRVLTKVFSCSSATLGSRLVLLALADSSSDDGVTWIPQADLAEKTLMSNSQVRDCLKKLEQAGEIESRKAQRGRRRINVYRISLPGIPDVDYDRLPFAVAEEFSRRPPDSGGRDDRRFMDDDRRNPGSTTADFPSRVEEGLNRQGNRKETVTGGVDFSAPPKLQKIDGRDVALDALCKECGIDPASPRVKQAAAAMNGAKGIRALFWIECVRYCEEHDYQDDDLLRVRADFESLLALRVEHKARTIREKQPWRTSLAPSHVRDLWLDIAKQDGRRGAGMTPDEIEKVGARMRGAS